MFVSEILCFFIPDMKLSESSRAEFRLQRGHHFLPRELVIFSLDPSPGPPLVVYNVGQLAFSGIFGFFIDLFGKLAGKNLHQLEGWQILHPYLAGQ